MLKAVHRTLKGYLERVAALGSVPPYSLCDPSSESALQAGMREATMTAELDPRAAGAKRLRDKVCVITGAGQGIGRATAKRLGAEDGKIVVAERIDESATRTTAELREHGVDATQVLADVSTFAGAKGLMDEALKAYARIDVLVNNVGGTIWIQPYQKYTEEQVHLELACSKLPARRWKCGLHRAVIVQ